MDFLLQAEDRPPIGHGGRREAAIGIHSHRAGDRQKDGQVRCLGVSDDDIADDYAASADAMDSLAGWMRDNRPEAAAAMAREPSAIASCPAEVMHSVLQEILSAWASVDGYLRSIGVSDETMSSVRSALTVPIAEKPRT